MDNEIKWYFNRNGVEEEVPIEKWVWHVVYKDGTELYQFGKELDTGKLRFHQIGEIDMDNVDVFEMIKVDNPKLRYSIRKSPEMKKIIHHYRRANLNLGTEDETHITFYCFGYKLSEDLSVYHFILPDDRIVVTTDRNLPLI